MTGGELLAFAGGKGKEKGTCLLLNSLECKDRAAQGKIVTTDM